MKEVDQTHHARQKHLCDMVNSCRHRHPHPGAAVLSPASSAAPTQPRKFARLAFRRNLNFLPVLALALAMLRKSRFDAGLKASASPSENTEKIKKTENPQRLLLHLGLRLLCYAYTLIMKKKSRQILGKTGLF
jgi:hypothetical protein